MYEILIKGITIILVVLLLGSCITTASKQDQASLALQLFFLNWQEVNMSRQLHNMRAAMRL